ncbi:hypothetical protein EV641_109206 [Rhodococcus sp. SMB37]|uniref:hypothetical protein n=1 Tax=Rhodococcus sp. SMB37 TaxID=2512213 RepID=UPI00104963D5|nr:hypothetical protein [Rhodococcus sp. SMB37]TCN51815.1 hypothetical protein EV641_109206 [Rhodococcus sp. SMB37]
MNGWWCVAETGQGGGLPDTLHGPYWDQEEARQMRALLVEEARKMGRRDRFRVCELDPEEDTDG